MKEESRQLVRKSISGMIDGQGLSVPGQEAARKKALDDLAGTTGLLANSIAIFCNEEPSEVFEFVKQTIAALYGECAASDSDGSGKKVAREHAKRAWVTNETMQDGDVGCDRCNRTISKGTGYLVVSHDPLKQKVTLNDIVCETCFDTGTETPWEGALPWEAPDAKERAFQYLMLQAGNEQ